MNLHLQEVRPLGHWTQNIKHYERKYGRWDSKTRLNMGPFRLSEIDTITIVSLEVIENEKLTLG